MGEGKRTQQRRNKDRERASEKITKGRLCHNCNNNFAREDLQDIGEHITHAIYLGGIISHVSRGAVREFRTTRKPSRHTQMTRSEFEIKLGANMRKPKNLQFHIWELWKLGIACSLHKNEKLEESQQTQ